MTCKKCINSRSVRPYIGLVCLQIPNKYRIYLLSIGVNEQFLLVDSWLSNASILIIGWPFGFKLFKTQHFCLRMEIQSGVYSNLSGLCYLF